MKKIFKYAVALLISAISFASCVKDNGNYDYTDIPSPKLTGFDVKVANVTMVPVGDDNLIRMKQSDLLTITPNINLSEGFDPEYSWKIFLKKPVADSDFNYEEPKVLGTERNLNVAVELSPETYKMVYKIINKKDNAEFIYAFEVQIQSISGLFVYHQDASMKGDFSAIRTSELALNLEDSELGMIKNVYSSSNNGEKIESPNKLFLRSISSTYSIFAMTKGGMKIVDYNKMTLTSSEYSSLFQYSIPEPGFTADFHLNGANRKEYMFDRGNIYVIDYAMMGGSKKFGGHIGGSGKSYAPFGVVVAGATSASGASVNVNRSVVFNATDKRFENTNSTSLGQFSTVSGPVNLEKTEMDLVYMDQVIGLTFAAVMKDAQNKLYFTKYTMTNHTVATCDAKIDLSSYSAITENSKWAIGGRGDAAFVSSGNQVNIFNHNNVSVTNSGIILPSGAEVAQLYVLKDPTNDRYDNALLFVCYNVGNAGFVDQYEFEPIGGVIAISSKKSFEGFDKIINVVLKK